MSDRKRALFVLSETGAGHRSVAEACAEALVEASAGKFQCALLDLYAELGTPFFAYAPAFYGMLSRRCVFTYNVLYRITDSTLVNSVLSTVLYRLVRRRLLRLVERQQPDVVLVTHPLYMAQILDKLRRDCGLNFLLVFVISDLAQAHSSWACPDVDAAFVFTDEVYVRLRRLGVPQHKLHLTAFPVRRQFLGGQVEKDVAQRSVGLCPDDYLLVLGGGAGSGGMSHVVRALAQSPYSQVVIVGKNRALKWLLRWTPSNVIVRDYVEDMATLMCACDAIVTKAGPSTIMEAAAIGRPLVICKEVGIQERGNGALAEAKSLGIWSRRPASVPAAVAAVLRDFAPGVGAATRGSEEIAKLVLRMLGQ